MPHYVSNAKRDINTTTKRQNKRKCGKTKKCVLHLEDFHFNKKKGKNGRENIFSGIECREEKKSCR